ncbi:MAG TPA: MATE family efflux transporter [Longimicrobiales bacterium]|nr:MATE family efflux transporter [Longimicrobiales bacterium]
MTDRGPPAVAPPAPSGSGLRALLPRRDELSELLRLALPVSAVQVGMMLMGVVDTVMVGHVSPADLAGVALGNIYFFGSCVFGMGLLFSLDPVVSQAVGAGDRVAMARGVQRGLVMAVFLSVAACLLLTAAGPVLSLLRQPPEVVPKAAAYAVATIPGVLPFYLFLVLRQTLQAQGTVLPIVAAMVVANVANVGFNWVLVYGNLGMPALGAEGSGWASSLSRLVLAVGVLAISWRLLRDLVRPFRRASFRWPPIRRMLGLGAPIGAQMAMEYGAFGAAGIFMGILGTVAVAGHQIALNLSALTFMVPLGISQATAVLVGRGVGAEDPPRARRAAVGGLVVGAGFMTGTMVLFLLLPETLARIYSGDVAVVGLAASLLPIAGLFQVFDGIQVVATGVLRGVGDTRVPMFLNLLGFWVLGIPLGLGLAFGLDLGPRGLWWGLAAGLMAVAALLLLRVRRRLAGALLRLQLDEDHEE